jgi:flagellar protein FliO/FliZ
MLEYILRLLIMLPVVGAMAWGSLWLWKKAQIGLPMGSQRAGRAMTMIDVMPLGPGSKLAVVEFGGKQIMIAISRAGITRLADNGPDRAGGDDRYDQSAPHAPYAERIYSDQGDGDFHVG